jgi:hypothetical protein
MKPDMHKAPPHPGQLEIAKTRIPEEKKIRPIRLIGQIRPILKNHDRHLK